MVNLTRWETPLKSSQSALYCLLRDTSVTTSQSKFVTTRFPLKPGVPGGVFLPVDVCRCGAGLRGVTSAVKVLGYVTLVDVKGEYVGENVEVHPNSIED